MNSWTPKQVFRAVAVGEAVTWALLLTGMFLKYVTETTELGVRVFGMVHGVVFIAYCLVTVVVAIDQRWSLPRTVAGLVAAVPPFATLLFEAYAERRGLLGAEWLSRPDGATVRERAVCWLLLHHRMAAGMLVVAVAGLTGLALLAGPPA
jgi:integral membrane protein